MPLFFVIFITVCFLLFCVFFFSWYMYRGISRGEKIYFGNKLHKIFQSHISEKDKVIQLDILLDKVLKAYRYTGTLGEKMKKHSTRFRDQEAIWKAHKLRNKLVHELDFTSSSKSLQHAVHTFKREISYLIR